jgi:hypothetical protein
MDTKNIEDRLAKTSKEFVGAMANLNQEDTFGSL